MTLPAGSTMRISRRDGPAELGEGGGRRGRRLRRGIFFVAFSTTGLVLSEVGTWVEPVFQGAALIIAVAISTAIARRRAGT
jgi:ribose/xylose/arabinose/galactoside ABC-type transport system permease subunit